MATRTQQPPKPRQAREQPRRRNQVDGADQGDGGEQTDTEPTDRAGQRDEEVEPEQKGARPNKRDEKHRDGHEANHGRHAEEPSEIPRAGWRDIFSRVRTALTHDNVSLIAAGLAMYMLLAVFPSLAAAVSIYGLFASPADVIRDMNVFEGILPPGAWDVLSKQLQAVAGNAGGTLSATAAVALGVSLWSARSGMASLMQATNVAYSERERRGFFRRVLVSLAFTAGGILAFLLMLVLGVATPVAIKAIGIGKGGEVLVGILQWVLLWLTGAAGLAVVYRYAPARRPARWAWVIWGSAIAAAVWLIGSALFALYVRTFAGYGKTYGTLGGIIALLMWFYMTSYIVVLGAEINAEMERQTRRDTTEGPQKPLGERGAYAADTVGPAAPPPKRH